MPSGPWLKDVLQFLYLCLQVLYLRAQEGLGSLLGLLYLPQLPELKLKEDQIEDYDKREHYEKLKDRKVHAKNVHGKANAKLVLKPNGLKNLVQKKHGT